MAATDISQRQLKDYCSAIFPKPIGADDGRAGGRVSWARVQCIRLFEEGTGNEQPGVRGTLWAAYNGVTEFIDRFQGTRTQSSRLDSIWFGKGYQAKVRAYRIAMDNLKSWRN